MSRTVKIIILSVLIAAVVTVGVLYFAIWSKKYDVTLELNGGVLLDDDDFNCKVGKEYTLPEPVKPGYQFDGWYSNYLFVGDSITTFSIKDRENKKDLSFYAKYVQVASITYELSGGTTNNPTEIRIDECVILADAAKPGSVFDGWYTDKEYKESILEIRYPDEDMVIYAKFIDTYDITYYLDGGMAVNPKKIQSDEALQLKDAEKPGTVFDGWYLDSEYTKPVAVLENVTGDVTLYAKFVDLVEITYELNGGTTTNPTSFRTDKTLYLSDPKNSGVVFDGWYLDSEYSRRVTTLDKPQEDVILYAKWVPGFPVIYNLGGGINHSANPDAYATEKGLNLFHPTRNGYTFCGWVDEEGNSLASIPVGATGPITVTALWQPNTYSISWVLNDGTAPSGYNRDSYVCGEGVAVKDMMKPVREGYIFIGWYKLVGNEEILIEYIDGETVGDLILRARWYDNTPVTQNNIWELTGERNDNSGTWTRDDALGMIYVPDELIAYANAGRLGVTVSATFRVTVITEGNSTASAGASLRINGKNIFVCSTSASGGGYNLLLGPQPGPTSIKSATVNENIVFTGTSPISLGCQYTFSSDKQNWAVEATLNYKCTSLTYSYYIIQ